MTKKHWAQILEHLVDIRKKDFTPIFYEGKEIQKVNVKELYIRFYKRDYMTFIDVHRIPPSEVKRGFTWTRQVFE